MFDELARDDFHKVRPLFTGLPLFLVIDAVIAGNAPARLWVDDAARPATVLMWDRGHCYYLVGNPANSPFNMAAQRWVAEQVARGPFYGKILYSAAAWQAVIPLVFGSVPLVSAERVVFALKEPRVADWAERVPAGFRITPINEPLLGSSQVINLHLVTEEISGCWNSLTDFLAEGFGFCLVRAQGSANGEEVVCWCTAEYVSGKKLGIGIETLPAYQGRGFATLTAAAFVQHCLASGLTPYWDAFKSNTPSLAVAEKVGFERVAGYTVFLARAQ
jgi:GNAT superfamily N-acetyltransferase